MIWFINCRIEIAVWISGKSSARNIFNFTIISQKILKILLTTTGFCWLWCINKAMAGVTSVCWCEDSIRNTERKMYNPGELDKKKKSRKRKRKRKQMKSKKINV